MSASSPELYYRSHGPWTDPGSHAAAVDALPADVAALTRVVRGVLIHGSWLRLYGLTTGAFATRSRSTLPVETRLTAVLTDPARPLSEARPPASRAVGTCRDYALMLCSYLRQKGIPARVRCGFAAYFEAGRYEDHWVCEYWQARSQRWAVADAQLDAEHRAHLAISFDTVDLPAGEFVHAGEAWRLVRSGAAEVEAFGHGAVCGEWFLQVNLVRDRLALRKCEVSDWDAWREAPAETRHLDDAARCWCDRAAVSATRGDGHITEADEEQLRPFWQR